MSSQLGFDTQSPRSGTPQPNGAGANGNHEGADHDEATPVVHRASLPRSSSPVQFSSSAHTAHHSAGPKKIAVLTSGGDSAGMNAAVRAVVRYGIARGCQAYIIREGWEGLVRGNATEPTPASSRHPSNVASPAINAALNPRSVGFGQMMSKLSLDNSDRPDDPFGSASAQNAWTPMAFDSKDPNAIARLSDAPLSFGYGGLLRDGAGEGDPDELAATFSDHPPTIEDEVDDNGRSLKDRYIVRVGWDDTRSWLGEGGTLIGSSRCPSFRTREGRLKATHNLIKYGIDCLAICGGDGSLTGADVLRGEWPDLIRELHANGTITDDQFEEHQHLNIVGLVGSIDNDMSMTDQTIGADTALHRICEAVDSISSTASSHSRAFVIEVMGRHCGWLALMAGVATGADFIFIPEDPPSGDWEEELCGVLHHHRQIGKRKSIVIVAEGALDANLKPIKGDYVKDILTKRLGLDTRLTTLGHTQRGGKPSAADRILATLQGVKAVEALLEATPETPSYMIGIQENKITKVPLLEAVAQTKAVAEAIENKDFAKAISYRDADFQDMLEAFKISSSLSQADHAPEGQRLRLAIIHVGAPAGGMNAATRQAVRYCLARAHTPLGIHNGFEGLLDDNITELTWLRVDNWTTRGGSELGTNRTLPNVDMGGIAAALQRHKIDGLLLIGGFEAFSAVTMLEKARKDYPALHIPIIHIPATISNNVPLTDFSLGSDTSLNVLVSACDAIKQSASASRNRVFVVETQGGMSGYLATLGALAVGAVLVYTPEEGINLRTLLEDAEFLKERYKLDEKGQQEGRLVVRSEKSSSVYTTDFVTKVLKEEGKDLFDARSAQLGHTLQGLVPSPLDRTRAARMALLSVKFLEKHAHARSQDYTGRRRTADLPPTDTAAMIAVRGSKILYAKMSDVISHTDVKLRRGEDVWWYDIKRLVEILGGRTGLVTSLFAQSKRKRPVRHRYGSYQIAGVNDDCPVPNLNPTPNV
ncbi:ATP-dependent 6-phosphofructokinase [Vanrija pseudolonga]|uniref:ATP-dependent 6-phosphofructokinase n=1 Tax=Vanrija pseudolonga TaxID=143232 RepID=A0AAF1BEG7_9TREE|nr:ATP-dependent 6-phosphofructokinase [Vanrija pseudolonga]